MGGQVALETCGRLTERLAGLVLISTTPRFTASEDFPWGLAPVEVQGMALKLRRNARRALEGFMGRLFAAGELADPALAAEVQALLDDLPVPDTGVALESLDALAEADQRPLLPPIGLPTLVINGEYDRICLPGASDYLVQRIRCSSRQVFPGCGHAPFLTRSREFDACLAQFCRRVREQDR
jgi:pimeloyl-[acyl-carrier protein] methyl ester esterase